MEGLLQPVTEFMAKQDAEAKAEEIGRNTPISYWCTIFDDCVYSPRDFYEMVERNLARRQVPDLLRDYILLHEGTVFSRRRLYYQMRRERIVAEVCAAPFGSGFFISSRLFDRRRRAHYWDYLGVFSALVLITVPVSIRYGPIVGTVIAGTVFTTLWSLMRLAVNVSFAWLDEKICMMPFVGPIYETWFHPDTYYRQDRTNMYREAVNRAVKEAVGELTAQKGLRPLSESESRPILAELR